LPPFADGMPNAARSKRKIRHQIRIMTPETGVILTVRVKEAQRPLREATGAKNSDCNCAGREARRGTLAKAVRGGVSFTVLATFVWKACVRTAMVFPKRLGNGPMRRCSDVPNYATQVSAADNPIANLMKRKQFAQAALQAEGGGRGKQENVADVSRKHVCKIAILKASIWHISHKTKIATPCQRRDSHTSTSHIRISTIPFECALIISYPSPCSVQLVRLHNHICKLPPCHLHFSHASVGHPGYLSLHCTGRLTAPLIRLFAGALGSTPRVAELMVRKLLKFSSA
jgi:hypothetical protein